MTGDSSKRSGEGRMAGSRESHSSLDRPSHGVLALGRSSRKRREEKPSYFHFKTSHTEVPLSGDPRSYLAQAQFWPRGLQETRSEVDAKTLELVEVQRQLIRGLESELEQLKSRVAHLEDARTPAPARGPSSGPSRGLSSDPFQRWIDAHLDELAKHPNCYVAIDPTRGAEGLVVHESDGAVFHRHLQKLFQADPQARKRLLLTHTSDYLDT